MYADTFDLMPSETSTHETYEPKKKPLKVKRGDRVRLLEDHDTYAKAGMRGVVLIAGGATESDNPLLRITSRAFKGYGHGTASNQWYVPVSKLRRIRTVKGTGSGKTKASKTAKRAASRSTVSKA